MQYFIVEQKQSLVSWSTDGLGMATRFLVLEIIPSRQLLMERD